MKKPLVPESLTVARAVDPRGRRADFRTGESMNRYSQSRALHAIVTAVVFLILFPLMFSSTAMASAATFDHLESSFELPKLTGNPFDFTRNDVKVTFIGPDHQQKTVPAFFDGGHTWRVRFTPEAAGKYSLSSVTLNGHDAHSGKLSPTVFDVSGPAHPGFIRIAADHHTFVTSDGLPYYPLGYNLAWHSTGGAMPPITESLDRMGTAGVNWTRIWMTHWDGKNLDWTDRPADQPAVGELSLKAAKLWDQIVAAADTSHVYFQLVLQHHGQYSTHADPNWSHHPWNKTNGGWLNNPAQFFTDPKAIALTRAKYRYIIARWGYSPAIMAWELFNEVESTDGFKTDLNAVAKWHADMAAFFREQDPYHHLITTSSWTTEPKLWPAMDYFQAHVYPPDILSSIANLDDQQLDRPYFYGEIGLIDGVDRAPAETIHRILWASLMSRSSGAAQYWSWDTVEPSHLLAIFTAAHNFIEQSGILSRADLKPIDILRQTADRGPLTFGPALGWASSTQTHFHVLNDGKVDGIVGMSAYLQGIGKNHAMFPAATFDVDYPAAGSFAVHVDQITANGAKLVVSIDGQIASTLDVAALPEGSRLKPNVDDTLSVEIPNGKHSIRLENVGADWIRIRDFTLTPYAPRLGVLAKGDAQSVFAWVFRRAPRDSAAVVGTLQIPGLTSGEYQANWFDTDHGTVVKQENLSVTNPGPASLTTPPVEKEIALWIARKQR
jgi:hypothetical protein